MIREFAMLRALGLLRRGVRALESIAAAQLRAHPAERKQGRMVDFSVPTVADWNARRERERDGLGGGPEDTE